MPAVPTWSASILPMLDWQMANAKRYHQNDQLTYDLPPLGTKDAVRWSLALVLSMLPAMAPEGHHFG